MNLLKKAEKAFEEAKELICLNKLYAEKRAVIEKKMFSKGAKKSSVKSSLFKLEEDEKILEIASKMFIEEHNLSDSFMGDLEDWIKEEFDFKAKEEKDDDD